LARFPLATSHAAGPVLTSTGPSISWDQFEVSCTILPPTMVTNDPALATQPHDLIDLVIEIEHLRIHHHAPRASISPVSIPRPRSCAMPGLDLRSPVENCERVLRSWDAKQKRLM